MKSSCGAKVRCRKISDGLAYVTHKEAAAIADDFPDNFIATQRAGLAGDRSRFWLTGGLRRDYRRTPTMTPFAFMRAAVAGAESHSRQARNKFPDGYHRFIIVTHSWLAVDNCRIVAAVMEAAATIVLDRPSRGGGFVVVVDDERHEGEKNNDSGHFSGHRGRERGVA